MKKRIIVMLALLLTVSSILGSCRFSNDSWANCYIVHQAGQSHLPGERRCD